MKAIITFENKNPSINTEFRKNIVDSDPKEFSVEVSQLEECEFLVRCILPGLSQEWILLDGIAQERECLRQKGIHNHPFFDLVCMSDLYFEKFKDFILELFPSQNRYGWFSVPEFFPFLVLVQSFVKSISSILNCLINSIGFEISSSNHFI